MTSDSRPSKAAGSAAPGVIDAYIARQPEAVRERLARLRDTIRAAAPEAEEAISYQIPTLKFHGNLVHFAAWKTHIGFYPASSGIAHFAKELQRYRRSRGAVQFPHDRPLPYGLIARMVRFRAKENQARAAAKARGKAR